jgi:NO-binding membrane sensor protein with MHYT domain
MFKFCHLAKRDGKQVRQKKEQRSMKAYELTQVALKFADGLILTEVRTALCHEAGDIMRIQQIIHLHWSRMNNIVYLYDVRCEILHRSDCVAGHRQDRY